MKIAIEEVAHVAQLSRLAWTEEEMTAMQQDLTEILEYMRTLEQLEQNIEDLPNANDALCNVTRDDTILSSYPRDALLTNAPRRNGEYLVVPKTVE